MAFKRSGVQLSSPPLNEKSLNRSHFFRRPVTKLDTFQTCEITVEKVKTLTLRVRCPDGDEGGRSVWVEPLIFE